MTARPATLLILLLTQTAVFGAGGTFTGRVERVIDGDTIIVRATMASDNYTSPPYRTCAPDSAGRRLRIVSSFSLDAITRGETALHKGAT